MKSLKLAGLIPLVLVSATAFAQGDNRAVPRGSGGGSSSDGGSRTTGGSASSSSSGSGSSASSGGSSSSSSGRNESYVPDSARTRPRPGTGSGTRDRYGNDGGRYRGYPNSYYYYDPYAYSWGYRPYSRYGYGYSDYGYSYGDYYGYYPSYGYGTYRYRSGNISQIRTLVEPNKARVYVDGYYAGTADDFDGIFQRLNVSPGRHEISLRLEGYNSHTFSVYAGREQTVKLRWDMVKGSGETRDSIGDDAEDRDRDRDDRDLDRDEDRSSDVDRDRRFEGSARIERDRSREVDSDREPRYTAPRDSRMGVVQFEIEPADASVYVDGEFFGKASQLSRVELPEGRHRIEVVRPGYKTEETEIELDRDAKKVVVRLERR
jgi:hypothetical protein